MQILKGWRTHFRNGSLPMGEADQPISRSKRRPLRRFASDLDNEPYADSEAAFRVWCRRDQVTEAIGHLEFIPLVRAALNSFYDAFPDPEPAAVAARTVLFIADAFAALEVAERTEKRWKNVGSRTALLEGLRYAEMAVIKVRSTLRQVDEVGPPLREMYRRHKEAINQGAEEAPSLLSKASRSATLDSLTRLEAEVKILKDVLKFDISTQRQRSGSIAQYREALGEVEGLAFVAFGEGIDMSLRRRLVFGALRAFNPDIQFEDDTIRKVL